MPNAIKNATGLDLGGWAGAGLIADETNAGAPGRVAVVANGGGNVSSPTAAVADGATIWVQSFHLGTLAVEFGNGVTSALTVKQYAKGSAARGIPSTFRYSEGRVTVPAGAGTARLRGGSVLLKPYLSTDGRKPCGWRPGAHDNPDLDLARWPDSLPLPEPGAYRASPTGLRSRFDTDSRVPITERVASLSWTAIQCQVRLDMAQRDALQQFYETGPETFWFVRPDTDQVCRAWWLDEGDPSDSGLGPGRKTTYGLLLEPA